MLLAIDVGNTTIQAGVFRDTEPGPTWRLATDHERLADEYGALITTLLATAGLQPSKIDGVIIASVVPALLPVFQDLCRQTFDTEPLIVGPGIRTGLQVRIENVNELGADRLADAVAAVSRHGPPPLIVVDFGTATVFDAIDASGDYVGGAISPGISVAAGALFERASRLARVELIRPPSAIGRSTETAIQSGVLFGYVGLVEGIVSRFKAELGGGRVIATGGWAERIVGETRVLDVLDPDLTLYGLELLYRMNTEGTP